MKQPTIAIIGAGAVGSATAFALLMQNIPARIMMVDIHARKCEGEVKDLQDALFMNDTSALGVGSLREAGQADIIILTAGIPQKPGQTRFDILRTNYEVVSTIIHDMKPIKQSSIIIVVTNPVDVLTRHVQEIAGLPQLQVFGAGTLLDTLRLRRFLAERLCLHPTSIDAYVLGEHGDSQFCAWSIAQIGGVPLTSFSLQKSVLQEIEEKTKRKAYEIIATKGFTASGIAATIAVYCKNIIADSKRIYPVSCFIKDLGVCLSMPAVLGLKGVERIISVPLDKQEKDKLMASANIVDQQYTSIQKHL